MLVRVALGRQIKERQSWVDQAEPRRFLVSFDVESDSYAAAAREYPTSVEAVPEIEPRLGTLEEVGATDEAGYLVVGADDFEELGTRRTETHTHAAVVRLACGVQEVLRISSGAVSPRSRLGARSSPIAA